MSKTSSGGEQWGTKVGVILAVAGSAVGLGNFLRFPGVAAQNGGGAFMIPYFIALAVVGIPIAWAEWTMGRYAGRKGFHSCPAIMGVVGRGPLPRYLGVFGLLIPLVVYMYYGLIESWCLQYAWAYASGGFDLGVEAALWPDRASAFFAEVSGSAEDGSLLNAGSTATFAVIVLALNAYFVSRGLSGGVEKFCQMAMPAMAICAVIVLIRVLTLGTPDPAHPELNVETGLGFMWDPEFDKLKDAKTWLAAAGQIFFSLSVGFGVIINYASYLRKKDDVVLSGLTAAATNEVFEVGFGGLITLTSAFVFLGASSAADAAGSTFGLGFNTLPVVFEHMGAFGHLIGALWFFMLFLAAITSSLSMMQPVKAFMQESLGLSNRGAVGLVVLVAGLGSLWNLHHSKGLVALDTMDFWVGTAFIYVLATVQIITFAWIFGVDRGLREAHHGAKIRIPKIFRFVIKYVAPTYLIAVFGAFCVQTLPNKLGELADSDVAAKTMVLVLAVLLFLVVCIRIGEVRWRAKGLDYNGRYEPDDDDDDDEKGATL